jgi:hypothetical protein
VPFCDASRFALGHTSIPLAMVVAVPIEVIAVAAGDDHVWGPSPWSPLAVLAV